MPARPRLLAATLAAAAVALPLARPAALTAQAPAPAPAKATPQAPQAASRPEDTEVWGPAPRVVTPAPYVLQAPPADAIVLFDGTHLDEWVNVKDRAAAGWTIAGDVLVVNKSVGNIETRRRFTNYQLHLEWRVPKGMTETGQSRGNSGVFLASTGGGDLGYELQVLDSFENTTYVNGQAGAVYKQAAPLANAMRRPGEWNTYDIVWTAPTFNADGSVRTPAYLTAFHNGVLIHDRLALQGPTLYIGRPQYRAHGASPIKLQSHGDPSPPIAFRNIWVREL